MRFYRGKPRFPFCRTLGNVRKYASEPADAADGGAAADPACYATSRRGSDCRFICPVPVPPRGKPLPPSHRCHAVVGPLTPGGYLANPSIDAVGRGVEVGEAVICHVFWQKNWPVFLPESYAKDGTFRRFACMAWPVHWPDVVDVWSFAFCESRNCEHCTRPSTGAQRFRDRLRCQ